MLNQEFFARLELALSESFKSASDQELTAFWCDGVTTSINQHLLTLDRILSDKIIPLRAWVGSDGQESYELLLYPGPESLGLIEKNPKIIDEILEFNNARDLSIDIASKSISIVYP